MHDAAGRSRAEPKLQRFGEMSIRDVPGTLEIRDRPRHAEHARHRARAQAQPGDCATEQRIALLGDATYTILDCSYMGTSRASSLAILLYGLRTIFWLYASAGRRPGPLDVR